MMDIIIPEMQEGNALKFIYSRQDMPTADRAQENCYLLTNGLGGYSSLSAAFSRMAAMRSAGISSVGVAKL